jgi:predicted transcriptional regulator YheO
MKKLLESTEEMDMEISPIIKRYIPIVKCIAETFGSNCEVVLHEFSRLPNSIVDIQNGQVTGRSVGSPMTEFSLNVVRRGETNEDIMNYTGKSMEGKVLKSSTVFIKDDEGVVIGCFCINLDMTELYAARKVIDDIMKISDDDKKREDVAVINKVNSVLNDIVLKTIDNSGKPVAYLSKDEKVTIVKSLETQGAFLIKGAIDYVAKVLCVSRYTIYNYLDEDREA